MPARIALLLTILLLSSCGQYSDSQEVTLNGRFLNLEKGLEPRLVFEAPPHWRREVDWAEVSGPDASFELQAEIDLKKTDNVKLTVLAKDYELLTISSPLKDKLVEFPPFELKKFRAPEKATSRVTREKGLHRKISPHLKVGAEGQSPATARDVLERRRDGGESARDLLRSEPLQE